MGKKIAVLLITLYQHTLSPDSGILKYSGVVRTRVCRFSPSCSEYTKNAIVSSGVLLGVWKGVKQLFRCHPFRIVDF
ncbi:MAG: hypothetical protein A3D67_02700 [Candidatus Lloydbacteria bacterium RIFCSPHIGHO2_02_FULL_51_22]|uniref:Membrane protein insertion efficiency factor YidD n=1 Tax=Candidatus Lloydbacteria bacterium RIFCSPHIGHO2_02_FULL_51_22 TaxID=1798663 RepID=A0A1G2DDC0_9BACT|nr:MAG: hypothetical protein A3D67_02700 [Candidatus Lloydbacteria bacterium RIFCSPHIGHO2_02_FULL_51_22]